MKDTSRLNREQITEISILKQGSVDLDKAEAEREGSRSLEEKKDLYRSLFENMLNGFAYCRMLFDQGRPQDFIYLDVNSAFESLTGLKNVVGKKATEVIPGIRESDPGLFDIYGRVAWTGIPEKFEMHVAALKMWFSVSVYSPQKEHFVAIFDVTTEHKLAQDALREREQAAKRLVRESELLAEIGRTISSTPNIEEVYERFVEKVREAIPFDRITISTVNVNDNTHTIKYLKGVGSWGARRGEARPLAGTRAEKVVHTKSILLVSSTNRKEMKRKFPGMLSRQSGPQTAMLIPLISKDGVFGVLNFQSAKADAYSENDLRLAERVGSQIAGAFANAQLFRELTQAEEALQESEKAAKRLVRESELIAEVGQIINSTLNIEEVYERFAEKVREAIPFDRLAVNTVNLKDCSRSIRYVKGDIFSGNRIGDVHSLAGSATEEVVRTKAGMLINSKNRNEMRRKLPGTTSLQLGAQSSMLIPLISKDEVIAALAFHSVQTDAYSENDLRLAERVGSQIAGAVANAQLFLEQQQADAALKESQAKYCDLYENAPDMYFSIDFVTGAITECNETFVRTTGYSKEELIGRPIFQLYDANSAGNSRKSFQQFRATGIMKNAERRVKCKDGRILDVSLNVSAIRDKDGNIVYSRSIWHDITERKKYEEVIRSFSITDQLTGLYNRRGFITLAEQQLRVADRTGNGIVLLFADLDGLKKINDKLGHKSGDEAIIETAEVLKEVFRKMDIIARMGGDEFAVLAPDASMEYSHLINQRINDQIVSHNARAGRAYNLSLSIGMVYHDPSASSSLDELISRADTLMYEQKRNK